MIDHGIKYHTFRVNLVPSVISLANPPWQREVWGRPSEFETLDEVVHVLFDDFCDACAPEKYLGVSLRTEREVELMRQVGVTYTAVQDEVGGLAPDEDFLADPGWPEVVAAAGRLAPELVKNDMHALMSLREAGHQWPPEVGAGRARVVPAVVLLACPTWQREVWGASANLDELFDSPERFLGDSLRTGEEVELTRQLGVAYSAVRDAAYLDSDGWTEVVAAAGRLAQVMVTSDLQALAMLDDSGHPWPPEVSGG
ncbi:hypothetical protein JOD54_001121 [Actinokineospora baliensis]|uniref:SCO4402 family protein n=1 Tax=Actinokineospora baliensis TaxID=547056 RepID=UPI00195B3F2D|nr:hypothetical protein [Actinokineospora baliensis]MBM7770917.1 hypothetical protein [Actinokineospora baliensis]